MRAWLSAFLLMAALTAPVMAGSEEDALQVVQKWAAAFNASDVDAIVALYAPDAMFLGTGSRTVVLKTEEIRQLTRARDLHRRQTRPRVEDRALPSVGRARTSELKV